MTATTEEELREQIGAAVGVDATWQQFHVIDDQLAALADDVRKVVSHPLIPASVVVGGFLYDVDTGLLHRKV
jgi:carbonic anhydrase